MNREIQDYILRRVSIEDDGCWLWQKALKQNGYGFAGAALVRGISQYAHRISYTGFVGPIPEGLQIDHLCRVRACVNPRHLEPVDGRTNRLRSPFVHKAECLRGHPLTEENTFIQRRIGKVTRACKECRRIANKQWHEDEKRRLRAV